MGDDAIEARKHMATGIQGKKILITGGLGFIGSNLANACVALGADVTIYDCLDPNSGGNEYNIHDIRNDVDVCYQSILDFNDMVKAVSDKDIIFNCAASTSHPFSMREPLTDLDVNGKGVIKLLEAIRRYNSNVKLVHLGTSTQLGKLQYTPADERHPEFPTDIYSANKSLSEKYVLIYSTAYGLPATIIRMSNVFGPRASIHSHEFTFNNYFIGLALQNKEITVYGDGEQMRNVIFVDDLVDALISAALTERCDGDVIFAVGDEHYSVAQVAKETVRLVGGSVKFIPWPEERKKIDVGDAIISNQKCKSILNWMPQVTLEEGLLKTKAFYLNCLEEYFNVSKVRI